MNYDRVRRCESVLRGHSPQVLPGGGTIRWKSGTNGESPTLRNDSYVKELCRIYTGLITEIGTVVENDSVLVIAAPKTATVLSPGESVCVNGASLSSITVTKELSLFSVELSAETKGRTTLAKAPSGTRVNLELPLCVGDRLGGHLVQGHIDAVGKVTRIEPEPGGSRRVWIRPPKRSLEEIIAKGSVTVDGVSVTVAERLNDRFSVVLIPITLRDTTLADLQVGDRVNLEADLFVKSARDHYTSARTIAHRTLSALPWSGAVTGAAGVEKCAAHLAAGGGVLIFDPEREGEADVVFAGATMRPESFVFLLTQACGHTTVPCDRDRLDRLEIPPMPGTGDRHGTAFHVSVDLAAGNGTGVSAHERAATVRRLANPEARPEDFLQPGHVFPLAAHADGLGARRGHTEASLALCSAAGLATVAVICEVMAPDGRMLSGSAVERFALAWSLPMMSVDELATSWRGSDWQPTPPPMHPDATTSNPQHASG